MEKCSCYFTKEVYCVPYDPYNTRTKIVGCCMGTKEMEECSCGGYEAKCNFYPKKREEAQTRETTGKSNYIKAIDHFRYGVSHDIFKEPVTSYAEIAIKAINRQIPNKVIEFGKYGFKCPCCNEELGLEKEGIFIYDIPTPKYCENCGQALDWKSVL